MGSEAYDSPRTNSTGGYWARHEPLWQTACWFKQGSAKQFTVGWVQVGFGAFAGTARQEQPPQ
jgi:hypothetical protein